MTVGDTNRESSVPEEKSSRAAGSTWRPGGGRNAAAEREDDQFKKEPHYQQTPRPAPLAADRHEWGP